ncbi:laccase domain-containing protein [Anaerosalibacter sp. Marseille-P3206]|uniref:laccase domain-containing protein n=1 Tax=Anaerosalibacter sp. Marseille-P3206 TaxID=1871005 RepID=UPI000984C0D4|nr:laccase domain-containing protein [Anaerosalibacter sp. Marseille-P3206]
MFYSKGNDKWYLNLWQANKNILIFNGVPKENITVSRICTSCNVDKFYSYRKEKGTKERMVAAIKLVG